MLKIYEIWEYIGISCKGFEDQFKAIFIAIEVCQPLLARSYAKKDRVKRFVYSINYDAWDGSANKGKARLGQTYVINET